jgi:hypothetical protein
MVHLSSLVRGDLLTRLTAKWKPGRPSGSTNIEDLAERAGHRKKLQKLNVSRLREEERAILQAHKGLRVTSNLRADILAKADSAVQSAIQSLRNGIENTPKQRQSAPRFAAVLRFLGLMQTVGPARILEVKEYLVLDKARPGLNRIEYRRTSCRPALECNGHSQSGLGRYVKRTTGCLSQPLKQRR